MTLFMCIMYNDPFMGLLQISFWFFREIDSDSDVVQLQVLYMACGGGPVQHQALYMACPAMGHEDMM